MVYPATVMTTKDLTTPGVSDESKVLRSSSKYVSIVVVYATNECACTLPDFEPAVADAVEPPVSKVVANDTTMGVRGSIFDATASFVDANAAGDVCDVSTVMAVYCCCHLGNISLSSY